MEKIYRVETYKCISCGKCELACGFAHSKDGKAGIARIKIKKIGIEKGMPVVCFQCVEALCVKSCPVGALVRNEETGAIDLLEEKCIRCKMCVVSCPFGNIQWDENFEAVAKCDLCKGDPQCVPFCPTKALSYY